MIRPNRSRSTATALALVGLLALLGGPLACTPAYHDQDASWEPPTEVRERVDRIRDAATPDEAAGDAAQG